MAHLPVTIGEAAPEGSIRLWCIEGRQRHRSAAPDGWLVGQCAEDSTEAGGMSEGSEGCHCRFTAASVAVAPCHRRQCFDCAGRHRRPHLSHRPGSALGDQGIEVRQGVDDVGNRRLAPPPSPARQLSSQLATPAADFRIRIGQRSPEHRCVEPAEAGERAEPDRPDVGAFVDSGSSGCTEVAQVTSQGGRSTALSHRGQRTSHRGERTNHRGERTNHRGEAVRPAIRGRLLALL